MRKGPDTSVGGLFSFPTDPRPQQDVNDPKDILQRYWHYPTFRPLQEEIIRSVMAGHDTLALMPTGGGKSLCYQVPALALDGITLVVSPLIALMKDQVRQLRQRRIKAEYIVANMTRHEVEVILNNCIYGDTRLLYVSPERLTNRTFIDHCRQMNVSLIAVDEAHCISQWGYDFRPPYLEIANLRQYHPKAPVIALTATATPAVVSDIQQRLLFRNGQLFHSTFFRSNLSYSVRQSDDKQGTLLHIITTIGGNGIVYVRNRRRAVELAQMLNRHGVSASAYHAGIEQRERDRRQRLWSDSKLSVMVATSAFGMGINKSDVRYVIHYDLPESLEAYFQEAGRAGRDGQRAYAVLLCHEGDKAQMQLRLERDFPPLSFIRNVYNAICNHYQIPVGAGNDCRFDFDAAALCRTYNLDIYTFFSALKFLEREGLILLPEHSELQSRLYIPISKEALYTFQLNNRQAGDLLSVILRLYGGIFTEYTPIDESRIAQRTTLTDAQVQNLLGEMHRLKIVEYLPKTVKPQIIFTAPRVEFQSLYISDRNYKDLRAEAERRQQTVIDYIQNDTLCRSRQLLAYFGEAPSPDCHCCDVCLSRHHAAAGTAATLEADIVRLVTEQPLTIKQLAGLLPNTDDETLAATVRTLLDRNKLSMDQDYRISVCNSQ